MTFRRPTPAFVLAALALFVALGGPAVAEDAFIAAKKKIAGKQIANNAITSKKIKNRSIRGKDIRKGVVPDAYTKLESDAKYQPAGAYLPASGKATDSDALDGIDSTGFLAADGKAVDADKLDGTDSSGFVQGGGAIGSATRSMNKGAADVNLVTLPGHPQLTGGCESPDNIATPVVTLQEPAGSSSWTEAWMVDGTDTAARAPYDSGGPELSTSEATFAPREVAFNLTRRASTLLGDTTVTNYRVFVASVGDTCRFSVTTLTQTYGGVTFVPPLMKP